MMRFVLTPLTLLAVCGSLAVAGAAASPNAGGAVHASAAPAVREWPFTLSPAPDNLALAEVGFPRAEHGQEISRASLQIALMGPFGDDYLVLAALRVGTGRTPRALLLLVNRPSALLDPVSVRLRLAARATLGSPVVRRFADPFARVSSAPRPALCDLALHGSALSAAQVGPLLSRGEALAGFDAASAVAQAYDAVCGLPYTSSFAQAVGQPAPVTPLPPAPSPPPSPSPPSPSPPPAPGPPVCAPCDPAPGYACPLSIGSDICAAPAALVAKRALAGAH
jgi:hypothetical protein